MHRHNAAECCAIRTFKNHFIASLCSVDNTSRCMYGTSKVLPQAKLMLNLLHGSRLNPKLSAHVQLHGSFNFNSTPLAPPAGTIRILVHIKPSWWYMGGPVLEFYRCFTGSLLNWDSCATWICETLS